MKKHKTKLVRSKIYDLIYYESLKDKPEVEVTAAQLARLNRGGAR